MLNNVIVLKSLISTINEVAAEMRNLEAAGVSRSELMSTLKVLGADMSYFGQSALTAGESVINAPMPGKAVKQPNTGNNKQVNNRPVNKQVPSAAIIYVDGSYKDGVYGYGFAVYKDGIVIHKQNGIGNNAEAAKQHNVAGEMLGAIKAVQWAAKNGIAPITLVYDYKGIAAWAQGSWKAKNEFTQFYANFMAKNLSWVSFQKVAGHTGVEGNELADKLAKEAVFAALEANKDASTEESVQAAPPVVGEVPAPDESTANAPEPNKTEEQKPSMTTKEFNSQEPDDGRKRFEDNMAKAFANAKESENF